MVNFVGIPSESKDIKLKNLLIVGGLVGFITILFHFTVVFFFGLILKSVFLVGLFLAISNVISLIFDIPIGVLQKYIKPKSFMILSGVMLILATLVFFKFVYMDGLTGTEIKGANDEPLSLYSIFSSFINFLLLILAASLYGLQSETFGVTSFSYILNNTSPTEYSKYLSRYNIATGAGSMVGLVFSGILLGFNIQVALFIFLILTIFFTLFVAKYFDNGLETINLSDIKNLKIDSFKPDLGKSGKKISQIITKENLIEITKETKILFLKPLEMKNSINFKEIYDFTILNFQRFIRIIFLAPVNVMMFWVFFILMQFSFWDTFVSTFMIEFLEEVMSSPDNPLSSFKFITGYVLLGIIAIPGFVLQDPFINLSKKIGEFKILMFGTFLSGLSLFLFGFFQSNVMAILLLGIINSVGYAAVIGIGQGLFSEKYNILYAVRNNLKEIDSTVSAAPLKIVLNLANVVGLLIGSLIVETIGFAGFFFAFGGLLLGLLTYSIFNYKKINEAGKEGEELFGGETKSGSDLEEFDGEVFKG